MFSIRWRWSVHLAPLFITGALRHGIYDRWDLQCCVCLCICVCLTCWHVWNAHLARPAQSRQHSFWWGLRRENYTHTHTHTRSLWMPSFWMTTFKVEANDVKLANPSFEQLPPGNKWSLLWTVRQWHILDRLERICIRICIKANRW